MKKRLFYAGWLIAAVLLFSCNGSTPASKEKPAAKKYALEKIKWLLGAWENRADGTLITESWEQKNDSVYIAKGYVVVGTDTVSAETIRLEQKNGSVYYIPTVSGQNEDQPVVFTLTSASDREWVFENPEHDFPQKITYTQVTPDSLVAEISGMVRGKKNAREFSMKRIK